MKKCLFGWVAGFFLLLSIVAWGDEEVILSWDPGTVQTGATAFATNSPVASNYYFKVTTEVTSNSLGYWRTVLNVSSGEADLYIREDFQPTTNDSDYYSEQVGSDTIVSDLVASNEQWYILVAAEAGAEWSLFAGDIYLTELTWDPGTAESGTEVFTNIETNGGAYYFKIITENADLAAWRMVVKVLGGEADLLIREDALPFTNSAAGEDDGSSNQPGDDGLTRYLSNTSGAGDEWYLLVQADAGSTWSVFAGDVFVTDLGTLATNAASGSGAATVPPERVRYYKTMIPAEAYGWRLWLQDAAGSNTLAKTVYVRKGLAPHSSSVTRYDRALDGQGLLVPDYLEAGGGTPYYIGIEGTNGFAFQLDSRQQEITTIDYDDSLTNQTVSGFLHKTYRINVSEDDIDVAWDVTLDPLAGTDPDMAIGLSRIPNADNNLAFSELVSTNKSESITLVPPVLDAGAYYITVYGDSEFSFDLHNREPVITQIDYESSTLNDDPDRAGWRFFSVTDIDQQEGSLGWLLELTNHVAGSEIAIRRNNIPGRWNYREDGSLEESVHSDRSSTLGFLQDPAHQTDVWYVGIYSPDAALGTFTLDSGHIVPIEIAVDASTNAFSGLQPQSWNFFYLDIPAQTNGADVIGWELRVQEWSGSRPVMAVRLKQLPDEPETTVAKDAWGDGAKNPYKGTNWITGESASIWATDSDDWAARTFDATHTQEHPQYLLSMGVGRPLVTPGRYYIGFFNESETTDANVTFVSRLIGSNVTYEVPEIDFDGGSITNLGLPAREVAYVQVDVPTNTPNWNVRLENLSGESALYIRREFVPTWGQEGKGYLSPGEQNNEQIGEITRLQKDGDEYFMLFPENTYDKDGEPFIDTVPAGTYYLMVVSEGQNPSGDDIGTGTSSFVLHSLGSVVATHMGTLNQTNVLEYSGAYLAGEVDLYAFTNGAGIGWIKHTLTNTLGNPYAVASYSVVLENDAGIANRYGGMFSGYTHEDRGDVPCISNWNVVVSDPETAADIEDGSYTLKISRWPFTPIDFYDASVTNFNMAEPMVYRVVVPTTNPAVIGWELRVTEWTGERPVMTVCRERFPNPYKLDETILADVDNTSWKPATSNTWLYGAQWATDRGDWTGRSYDPTHTQRDPQYLLSMGMNRPLLPGTNYISFSSGSPSTFSFTSRAIGAGLSLNVSNIAFSGSAIISNLPAREVAYYKVEIPADVPSWSVQLENTLGESSLYIRHGYVPTWGQEGEGFYSPADALEEELSEVTRLQKTGDEYFTLLPDEGTNSIPAGAYYLMVVSEGENPSGTDIGSNSCSAVLHSLGNASVTDLGTLPLDGEVSDTNSYAAGVSGLYQFTVPDGVAGLEVRLEDRTGNPVMNLLEGTLFSDDDGDKARYSGLFSGYDIDDLMRNPDVVVVSSPSAGLWSLVVNDPSLAEEIADGSYTLRVVTLDTEPVAFDGGEMTVSNLPPNNWVYYKVDVPASQTNGDVIGWELRVDEWTGEDPPYMVVRRDTLPASKKTVLDDGTTAWDPHEETSWLSGSQWATLKGALDWAGYIYDSAHTQRYPEYLLSMGMGRPLEEGTYYVGFLNDSDSQTGSFHFVSRAIGDEKSYDVPEIDFDGGSITNTDLAARGVAYVQVEIPADTPSWSVQLENTSGESQLYMRKDYVPTWGQKTSSIFSPAGDMDEVTRLQKTGDEYFTLLPDDDESLIPEGTYYLMVVSEGQGPSGLDVGSGSSDMILHSLGEAPVIALGELPPGGMLMNTNLYEGGEVRLLQFTVPETVSAFEVRLENRVGDPAIVLLAGEQFPENDVGLSKRYGGMFSGYDDNEPSYYAGFEVATAPNAVTGVWSLLISDPNKPEDVANGSYELLIEALLAPVLNFDAALNTNGATHIASGVLGDDQRDFYQIEVPEELDGKPVIGWLLEAPASQGQAEIRARRVALPEEDFGEQTDFGANALLVVPPFLTPGTWYVELRGNGATEYTLTSSAAVAGRSWIMPMLGEPVTTPGLTNEFFGDSGVDTNGNPLAGDQGIDLDSGFYDLYAVTVPATNAGLLSTRLEVISGNPDLYIRAVDVPTLNHEETGGGDLYDRLLDSPVNTEYGNWVPFGDPAETRLQPGDWYLMVKAEGSSAARYRLKVAGGNVYSNGNVQALALDGGAFTSQLLAAGDWRYYRVEIPDPVPFEWNITFSETSGDVDLYLRDTVPPGSGDELDDIQDWESDDKLAISYPTFEAAGTHSLGYDELLPGHTYYLGFLAQADASFSVSSSTNTGSVPVYPTVDFHTGVVNTNLAAGAVVTYRINAPGDAVRWRHTTTNSADIELYLKQGSLPTATENDWEEDSGDSSLNQYLLNEEWPWLPGKSYYLTVTNSGVGLESFILVMNGSSAIETPTALDASDGTRDDHIRLSWTGIYGADAYEIWRNSTDDPSGATLIEERETSSPYSDYAATPGQIWHYWVATWHAADTNWFSVSDSGWRSATGAVSPDSLIYDYVGGTGQLFTVSAPSGTLWSARESESWFSIQSGATGSGTGDVVLAVSLYAGEFDRTGTVTIATQPYTVIQTAWGVPTNIVAADGLDPDILEITWDAMPHAGRYYVHRSETNDPSSAVEVDDVTTNQFDDTTAVQAVQYYYWIEPRNVTNAYGGFSDSDPGHLKFAPNEAWRTLHFPSNYPGDHADSDLDGFSNLQEYIAGTIPTNAASYYETVLLEGAGGVMTFDVDPSLEGRIYDVLWSGNLLSNVWNSLNLEISGDGVPFTIIITNDLPYKYYRQTVYPALP